MCTFKSLMRKRQFAQQYGQKEKEEKIKITNVVAVCGQCPEYTFPWSTLLNVTKIVTQYVTPVPELLYLPTHVLPACSVCAHLHPRCSSCTTTACHTFCSPELLQHLRTGTSQGGTARDTHLLFCRRSPKAALYLTTHWMLVGDRCRSILLLVCFSCCMTASGKANDTMVRL